MREWRDIYRQLVTLNRENDIKMTTLPKEDWTNKPLNNNYGRIHRSVLTGYLSTIALKSDKNIYRLTKNREGMIYPGSGLFNNSGEWVCSFEQVKTSRLFLRTVGNIDVEWLERLGGDLCKRSYSGPYYDQGKGEVRALERVSLFGLPIVYNRDVEYGRYNKAEATEIFIKSCLVEGDLSHKQRKELKFLDKNLSLIEKISKMENKLRQRNILVDESSIDNFYKEKIKNVSSIKELRSLIRKNSGDNFLQMKEEDLYTHIPGGLDQFPDTYKLGESNFKIDYHFDPGKDLDGVTIKVPAQMAQDVPKEKLDLAVPGLLKDRITALIKGLPKEYRKKLIPINQTVEDILGNMEVRDIPLHNQLSNYIYENWRFNIPVKTWDDNKLPEHLKVRISIIDNKGKEIASSRDKDVLYNDYSNRIQNIKKVKKAKESYERDGILSWDFSEPIEEKIRVKGLTYYPALKVVGNSVSLKLFDRDKAAKRSHLEGISLLVMNSLNKQLKAVKEEVLLSPENRLLTNYFNGEKAYYLQFSYRLVRNLVDKQVRNRDEFNSLVKEVSLKLLAEAIKLDHEIKEIFQAYKQVRESIARVTVSLKNRGQEFLEDVSVELNRLTPEDFIIKSSSFSGKVRYLKALKERVDKGALSLIKDKEKRDDIKWFEVEISKILDDLSPAASMEKLDLISEYETLLEEYRVSVYAGNIKIPVKVSDKRLEKLLDKIDLTI